MVRFGCLIFSREGPGYFWLEGLDYVKKRALVNRQSRLSLFLSFKYFHICGKHLIIFQINMAPQCSRVSPFSLSEDAAAGSS